METSRSQHHGAFSTPWPYLGISFLSILSSPITFGSTLLLGIVVGVAGVFWGALSRNEGGRARGLHILIAGISLLAGPAAYLALAVVVAIVDSN